jgi:hypothetical protein
MATTKKERSVLAGHLDDNLIRWFSIDTTDGALVYELERITGHKNLSHMTRPEVLRWLITNHVNKMI